MAVDGATPGAASDEATRVERKEPAMGPAEQVHAKARKIEERANNISAAYVLGSVINRERIAKSTLEQSKKEKQWVKPRGNKQ